MRHSDYVSYMTYSELPILPPPTCPIKPKISWTLAPSDLCMCTKFGSDRLRFAEVIPDRLIFQTTKVNPVRVLSFDSSTTGSIQRSKIVAKRFLPCDA